MLTRWVVRCRIFQPSCHSGSLPGIFYEYKDSVGLEGYGSRLFETKHSNDGAQYGVSLEVGVFCDL